jgi:uncharacterized membrane protein
MINLAMSSSFGDEYAIKKLKVEDLLACIKLGLNDFAAMPSHLLFLGLFYPIAGLAIAIVTAGQNAFYLLYPLLSGFVLIGPFAAIGLYEISRRREQGEIPSWWDALAVSRAPTLASILGLGVLLGSLFVAWLVAADFLYQYFFPNSSASSYSAFLDQVFRTQAGHKMIAAGNIIGFAFAIVAFSVSAFSFPMLLDRNVRLEVAIRTSLRAVWQNPGVCAAWGLIVTITLLLGIAAALMGLAIVMPVLAHATWHLYRRTIVHDDRDQKH